MYCLRYSLAAEALSPCQLKPYPHVKYSKKEFWETPRTEKEGGGKLVIGVLGGDRVGRAGWTSV